MRSHPHISLFFINFRVFSIKKDWTLEQSTCISGYYISEKWMDPCEKFHEMSRTTTHFTHLQITYVNFLISRSRKEVSSVECRYFLFYYYDEFLTSLAMFLIGFIVFIEQTASSGEGEIAFINSKHDRYCAWTHVQYSIYLFSQWSKVNIKFSRDIRELQSVMNHFDEIIACYFIKSLLKAAVAATLF